MRSDECGVSSVSDVIFSIRYFSYRLLAPDSHCTLRRCPDHDKHVARACPDRTVTRHARAMQKCDTIRTQTLSTYVHQRRSSMGRRVQCSRHHSCSASRSPATAHDIPRRSRSRELRSDAHLRCACSARALSLHRWRWLSAWPRRRLPRRRSASFTSRFFLRFWCRFEGFLARRGTRSKLGTCIAPMVSTHGREVIGRALY